LGRRGDFYKTFAHDQCKFQLENLYCGDRRSRPISLRFYTKRQQFSEGEYLESTRVEIKFHVKNNTDYDSVTLALLQSVFAQNGQFIKHIVFTVLLFPFINFSTRVKTPKKFCNRSKTKTWAILDVSRCFWGKAQKHREYHREVGARVSNAGGKGTTVFTDAKTPGNTTNGNTKRSRIIDAQKVELKTI